LRKTNKKQQQQQQQQNAGHVLKMVRKSNGDLFKKNLKNQHWVSYCLPNNEK